MVWIEENSQGLLPTLPCQLLHRWDLTTEIHPLQSKCFITCHGLSTHALRDDNTSRNFLNRRIGICWFHHIISETIWVVLVSCVTISLPQNLCNKKDTSNIFPYCIVFLLSAFASLQFPLLLRLEVCLPGYNISITLILAIAINTSIIPSPFFTSQP